MNEEELGQVRWCQVVDGLKVTRRILLASD